MAHLQLWKETLKCFELLTIASTYFGLCFVLGQRKWWVCFLPPPPPPRNVHTPSFRADVNAERGERGKQSSSERLASNDWRKWRSCRTNASPRRCCKRVEILLALLPAFLSTLLHFILQWGEPGFTICSTICWANLTLQWGRIPGTGVR